MAVAPATPTGTGGLPVASPTCHERDPSDGLWFAGSDRAEWLAGTDSHGASLDAALLKYDLDGTLVWSQTWGGPDLEVTRGVAVDDEHVYVAVGTRSYWAGGTDTVLLEYDKLDGDLLAARIWGDAEDEGVNASLVVADGYAYLIGNRGSDANPQAGTFMKVDLSQM